MTTPKIGDIDLVYDRPIVSVAEEVAIHVSDGYAKIRYDIPARSPDGPYLSGERVDGLIAESTKGNGDLWLWISIWERQPGMSQECLDAADSIDSQIALIIRKAFDMGRAAGLSEATAPDRGAIVDIET